MTLFPWSIAAFLTRLRAKAVLPMAGLAARITRSEGCQPPLMRSISLKPEATPVIPLFSPDIRVSMSFSELVIRLEISWKFLFNPRFLIS